jgi:hypothetical protein
MHKYCEKLYRKLVDAGFDSKIYKEDFIIFKSPFTDTPIIKNYHIRFDKNIALVFVMADIDDILANIYSDGNLAYALSQNIISFGKDGVSAIIKEGSLLISSLVTLGVFTTTASLYNKVYDAMLKCQGAFTDILSELKQNKK